MTEQQVREATEETTAAEKTLLAEIDHGPELDQIYHKHLQQTGLDKVVARRLLAEYALPNKYCTVSEYLVLLITELALTKRIDVFVDIILGAELNLKLRELCIGERDPRVHERYVSLFCKPQSAPSALRGIRKIWIEGLHNTVHYHEKAILLYAEASMNFDLRYFLLCFLNWLADGKEEDKPKIWDSFQHLTKRERARKGLRRTGCIGGPWKSFYDEDERDVFFYHLKSAFLGVAP